MVHVHKAVEVRDKRVSDLHSSDWGVYDRPSASFYVERDAHACQGSQNV